MAPDWNRSWDNRSCRDGLEDVSMNFVPFCKTRIGFRKVAELQNLGFGFGKIGDDSNSFRYLARIREK